MSNKTVCADADLTVFNLKTLIRLAVVEVWLCFFQGLITIDFTLMSNSIDEQTQLY